MRIAVIDYVITLEGSTGPLDGKFHSIITEGQFKTAHDWCSKTTSYFLNEQYETRTEEEIKTCIWECLEVKIRCRLVRKSLYALTLNISPIIFINK